jgi:hypothetical protein
MKYLNTRDRVIVLLLSSPWPTKPCMPGPVRWCFHPSSFYAFLGCVVCRVSVDESYFANQSTLSYEIGSLSYEC